MTDLEKRISETLKGKLDDVGPARVRRDVAARVRRRRLYSAALRGISAIAVVTVAAVGGRLVVSNSADDPSQPSRTPRAIAPAAPPRQESPAETVATGELGTRTWEVTAYRAIGDPEREGAVEMLCLGVGLDGAEPEPSCGVVHGEEGSFVDAIWFIPETGPSLAYGRVSEDVAEIEASTEKAGRSRGRVVSAPASLDANYRFFMVPVPPRAGTVDLIAKDSSGGIAKRVSIGRADPSVNGG